MAERTGTPAGPVAVTQASMGGPATWTESTPLATTAAWRWRPAAAQAEIRLATAPPSATPGAPSSQTSRPRSTTARHTRWWNPPPGPVTTSPRVSAGA